LSLKKKAHTLEWLKHKLSTKYTQEIKLGSTFFHENIKEKVKHPPIVVETKKMYVP
jgi:hypothetical protein